MNGDTYSSRGESDMVEYGARQGANKPVADSGRPRDYYRDERRERGGDRGERGGRGERRRSRSPHYGRSSRREYEADSYSSSRDYRAREREDRYSSRRDDREWDRDRGADRRRRDDDRPPRRERDRDLFEERPRRERERGDRDREGGDRDRENRRERRRSATPPPRKREATPDLTNVASVLDRKRRLTQWDIKPPGYENVTAEQAKLSGMFPLPGAPRQQPMDPSRLQAFMNQPEGGSADNTTLKPSNSRQAKRLFVYNVPPTATGETILSFFNVQLNGLNVIQSVDPCISAQVSDDRSYALLEFKTPSDATVALAFDGIQMEEHQTMGEKGAQGLEVRRPKDYILPSAPEQEYQEGVLLNEVPDSPNKICVSNIPHYIPEEPVTMLLKSFGELKSFVLVKDSTTEESRGIAFCEYADPAATSIAVEGLNGMELGDRHLKVVRASIGMTQAAGLDMGVNAMSMFAKTTSQDLETSRVLQLLNMVTPEELMDPDDYDEICDDVREECSKYGQIVDLKVPRPSGGSRQSPGVGKIFVKFDTVESTTAALKALAGRKFSDRTVVTTYYSEENFDVSAW
ncbi:splicing factor u2af large subunit [Aspergillus candidus]|uniref:Splicing factor U2AF subunit n=1 Tax=Aspergillus candidus TaxID=41067 RepID=A0A2I2FPW1_ASPCN|nr:hypothetical protein BDW47DRAFT_97627 [Aspergillus candidus]PLB42668.1 hypothetical protein BDW47DRAFT_97627 [Aspergillus candidus]